MMDKNQLRMLHYKYWIGIMLAVVVLLVASAFFDVPLFFERLTFALTLSSFVLAILAIVFMVSFNTLISNNLAQFVILNKDLKESAEKLDNSTKKLSVELSLVPARFDELASKVDYTNTLLESQTKQIAESESLPEEPQLDVKWEVGSIIYLLSKLSYAAMVALYLLVKIYEMNLQIKKLELNETLFFIEFRFLTGIAEMCRATKLLNYAHVEDAIVVNDCQPSLHKNLERMLRGIVEMFKEDEGTYILAYGLFMADEFIRGMQPKSE